MDNLAEVWRSVVGFENYEVSNQGRVRSLDRLIPHYCGGQRWSFGRMMKLTVNKDGYHQVALSLGSRDQKKKRYVHQLVAAAFIGPCPFCCEVNHKNGNKLDNVPDNLEYLTPDANRRHARETGLHNISGERNVWAKLTEQQIRDAHVMVKAGHTRRSVAKMLRVNHMTLGDILLGKKWKHLNLESIQ